MVRILLIDDEPAIRDVLEFTLRRAGYEVAAAPDGAAGMKLLAEFQPDLVITDILMPTKDGLEIIVELRRHRGDLPIVAMSGGGQTGKMNFLSAAESMGATRTLSKPFGPDELLRVVAEVIPATANPKRA